MRSAGRIHQHAKDNGVPSGNVVKILNVVLPERHWSASSVIYIDPATDFLFWKQVFASAAKR